MTDTELIQSQINAAWQTGGTVELEARDYFITGLTLPNDASRSITIRGAGAPRIYIQRSQANVGTRLIVSDQAATAISYAPAGVGDRPTITIENLTICGPSQAGDQTVYSGGHGIRIDGGVSVPIVRLSNVSITGFYGGCGVWLSNCENGSLADLHVLWCGVGFRGDQQFNAYTLTNVSAEKCRTYGIEIDVGLSLAFVGGMVQSNEGIGMRLNHAQSTHISGFHVENNAGGGIVLEGGCVGVAIEQSTFALASDRILARDGVYGLRIIGGLNNAAVELGADVRATLIDECVAPVQVTINGAERTRVVWDGVTL